MDDAFISQMEVQVLDFATDKRKEWEAGHHLYSVIFEITPKCNFNCVHCYLHDHHCSEELTYEEIIEIIDIQSALVAVFHLLHIFFETLE